MKSAEIYEALERIKAIPGKNDKAAALAPLLNDDDFRYVVVQALDPRITFGVAKKTLDKVKKMSDGTPAATRELGWENGPHDVPLILRDLASRELTGSAAELTLLQLRNQQSPATWNLIERILLKRLDIGATESTVNSVMPGLIFSFDCMLAHPYEAKRVKAWPVAVEPKIDGVRCLALVEGGRVGFFSRSGQEWTTFDHLKAPLLELKAGSELWLDEGFVLDGEIDSGSFNETVSQARKKDAAATDAVFRAFDLVSIAVWEDPSKGGPYYGRRENLEALIGTPPRHPGFQVLPRYLARDEDEIAHYYDLFRKRGLEGAIVKPLDHVYERRRSHSWMKMKAKETEDVRITGFFEGTGKYAGQMGGVYVDFKGVEVSIGGGWSDDDRIAMWTRREDFLDRLIEVEFHEITPDGSMRHPRFKRFRDDKDRAEAA